MKNIEKNILWNMSPHEIESKSFQIIESEFPHSHLKPDEWIIIRRLIHTTADFSIANLISFRFNPIETGIKALKACSNIYCDSKMIKSGISVEKLKKLNENYSENSIICHISDPDVKKISIEKKITKALASVEKAIPQLSNSVILIGNAPLALAKIAKLTIEKKISPTLIIGMPVGFVNVIEAKELLKTTNIPSIIVEGRRGGSTLAIATLHGIIECALR